MDNNNSICPNCGKGVSLYPIDGRAACPSCGRNYGLLTSSNGQIMSLIEEDLVTVEVKYLDPVYINTCIEFLSAFSYALKKNYRVKIYSNKCGGYETEYSYSVGLDVGYYCKRVLADNYRIDRESELNAMRLKATGIDAIKQRVLDLSKKGKNEVEEVYKVLRARSFENIEDKIIEDRIAFALGYVPKRSVRAIEYTSIQSVFDSHTISAELLITPDYLKQNYPETMQAYERISCYGEINQMVSAILNTIWEIEKKNSRHTCPPTFELSLYTDYFLVAEHTMFKQYQISKYINYKDYGMGPTQDDKTYYAVAACIVRGILTSTAYNNLYTWDVRPSLFKNENNGMSFACGERTILFDHKEKETFKQW